jgi:hypothetical protein
MQTQTACRRCGAHGRQNESKGDLGETSTLVRVLLMFEANLHHSGPTCESLRALL